MCLIAVLRFFRIEESTSLYKEPAASLSQQQSGVAILPSLLSVLIFLLVQSLFARHAWFQVGGDEYLRPWYAVLWAREPYFATEDHIWLAGHFYALGSLFFLTGSIKFSVAATSLLGTAALVFLTCHTVQRLGFSSTIALIVAVLLGANWMILWASVAAIAEVFFFPLLAGAVVCWLNHRHSETTEQRNRWLFGAAGLMGLATMFRYEAWMIGLPLGVYCLVALLRGFFQKPTLRQLAPLVAAPLVLALYPCLHVASCWIDLGSPTAFLTGTEALNVSGNKFYDQTSVLAKFFVYPVSLWEDHWSLLPLPLFGFCLAFSKRYYARFSPLILLFGVVLLFSMISTYKSGLGSNTRPRFSLFLLIILQLFAAIPLEILWARTGKTLNRLVMRGLMISMVFFTLHTGYQKTVKQYPNGWGLEAGDIELLTLLEHGPDGQRESAGQLPVQLPGFGLFVYTSGEAFYFWPVVYHAPSPEFVFPVNRLDDLQDLAKKPGYAVLAIRKSPDLDLGFMNEHYHVTHETGCWLVWQPN